MSTKPIYAEDDTPRMHMEEEVYTDWEKLAIQKAGIPGLPFTLNYSMTASRYCTMADSGCCVWSSRKFPS